MWRALIAALVMTGCATPEPTLREALRLVVGDFDGDTRPDTAIMAEDDEGVLRIVVQRAADRAPSEIWGGDISSFERFSISTAPAGTYRTACDLYGGCPADVPEQVTLTHDGVFVHEIDRANDTLYYWDGAAFQNIIVAE